MPALIAKRFGSPENTEQEILKPTAAGKSTGTTGQGDEFVGKQSSEAKDAYQWIAQLPPPMQQTALRYFGYLARLPK